MFTHCQVMQRVVDNRLKYYNIIMIDLQSSKIRIYI